MTEPTIGYKIAPTNHVNHKPHKPQRSQRTGKKWNELSYSSLWHRQRWSVIETKLTHSLSLSTVSNRQPALCQRMSTLQCTNRPSSSSTWCENGRLDGGHTHPERTISGGEEDSEGVSLPWHWGISASLGAIRGGWLQTRCSTLDEVQQWEGLPDAGAAASGHTCRESVWERRRALRLVRQIEIPPQGGLRDVSLSISHITVRGTCACFIHTLKRTDSWHERARARRWCSSPAAARPCVFDKKRERER